MGKGNGLYAPGCQGQALGFRKNLHPRFASGRIFPKNLDIRNKPFRFAHETTACLQV